MGPVTLAVDVNNSSRLSSDASNQKMQDKQLDPRKLFASISVQEEKPLDFLRILFEGFIAGATAGVAVETTLYPIDTIKTRLQNKILKCSFIRSYLPREIWSLKGLRHFKCTGHDIPDPCTGTDGCNDYGTVLEHLLTLSGVSARSCTQKILERMPSLKKLKVLIELAPDEVQTISFLSDITQYLHSLWSLNVVVMGLRSQVVSPAPTIFPETLLKLTLSGCRLLWKDIESISMLPHLQILKLRWVAFHGSSWNICTKRFDSLDYLLLEDIDIEEWTADYGSFQYLKKLFIHHYYKLNIIPREVLRSSNLECIEMDNCSMSAVNSVKQTQQEIGKNFSSVVSIIDSLDDNDEKHKARWGG